MIVRILEDDQYQLDDAHAAEFDQRDRGLLAAVEADDHVAFHTLLADLLAFIRANGTHVPLEEIVPSDFVVPTDDMTLAEAKAVLESSDATA